MMYFGFFLTITSLHKEDLALGAVNYLISGNPKYWLVIHKCYYAKLQQIFLHHREKCLDASIHKDCMVTVELLNAFGIEYEVFQQNPGDFIILRPGVCVLQKLLLHQPKYFFRHFTLLLTVVIMLPRL